VQYRHALEEVPFPGYGKRDAGVALLRGQLELRQNSPNPFNPTTEISFSLPQAGSVNLRIYSVTGQLVKTVLAENFAAGEHRAIWNGRNTAGEDVAFGVYFYVLSTDTGRATKSMTLLR
jgi:hypothetical protein